MQGLMIAAFVFSLIAMICSGACLVIMLAKNFFSSHVVQMQPVNPMGDVMGDFAKEMGRVMGSPFREIDDPMDDQEREHLEMLRQKQQSPKQPPPQPV